MVDWKKLEVEYVTTGISHRKLAEKYGLCRSTVSKKATEENWCEKRNKHRGRTVAKAVNAVEKRQVDRAAKLIGVSDLVLDKVKALLEDNDKLVTDVLKDVSVILKNLKDIQMIKSEADLREQEARIDKLRKEATIEKENNEVRVTIVGDLDEYSQ